VKFYSALSLLMTQGAGRNMCFVACRKSAKVAWSCASGICYSQRSVFCCTKMM